jgi:hypothetical protein
LLREFKVFLVREEYLVILNFKDINVSSWKARCSALTDITVSFNLSLMETIQLLELGVVVAAIIFEE